MTWRNMLQKMGYYSDNETKKQPQIDIDQDSVVMDETISTLPDESRSLVRRIKMRNRLLEGRSKKNK